jgi:siroheme synthase-like protein
MEEKNYLFPIFLKLRQINTLIVGGGYVAEEKLGALLKNDPLAKVTVVGTEIRGGVRDLASAHSQVVLIERPFEEDDLFEVNMVILATANFETNREISVISKSRGILTNAADTPPLCDFYLGSTVSKGSLKIGISTNGKSPTFAKRVREVLEETFPEDTEELLTSLKKIRDSLSGDFNEKIKQLNAITAILVEEKDKKNIDI